jgi:hypothetical protein
MSQMWYNRNSPKEVVYGPVQLGDPVIEQGIHQVTALVGHLRPGKRRVRRVTLLRLVGLVLSTNRHC